MFERANRLYESVEAELTALVPGADVQHVGSTAVPGSLTKGDLDVVVRVPRHHFEATDAILSQHFERNFGSDRTPEFSAFLRTDTDPDLGVQLVAIGSDADTFHIWAARFRSDANLRAAYDALKASCEGAPMDRYREEKALFFNTLDDT